jgi:hypothetical protein
MKGEETKVNKRRNGKEEEIEKIQPKVQ